MSFEKKCQEPLSTTLGSWYVIRHCLKKIKSRSILVICYQIASDVRSDSVGPIDLGKEMDSEDVAQGA